MNLSLYKITYYMTMISDGTENWLYLFQGAVLYYWLLLIYVHCTVYRESFGQQEEKREEKRRINVAMNGIVNEAPVQRRS